MEADDLRPTPPGNVVQGLRLREGTIADRWDSLLPASMILYREVSRPHE